VQVNDTVEKRLKVQSDDVFVLRVGQDLNQILLRQEVESGEDNTLRLDVKVQLIVDLFEISVHLLQLFNDVGLGADKLQGLGVAVCLLVELQESLVHCFKNLGFIRQLHLDRATGENVLQVAPLLLDIKPLFDSSGQQR